MSTKTELEDAKAPADVEVDTATVADTAAGAAVDGTDVTADNTTAVDTVDAATVDDTDTADDTGTTAETATVVDTATADEADATADTETVAATDDDSASDAEVEVVVAGGDALPRPNAELTAAERLVIARHPGRPGVAEIVDALFSDFFEQRGDRTMTDDPSILGGIAFFHGRPVTVLGNRKGQDIDERMRMNFGMSSPEGYRKAQRIMRAAEKFGRPVITFVDTPGAYPGLEAEEHGQGEAIARTIELMGALTVPTIAVITGEGGSGGALALAVGNRVLMLENAVYSVLSPEGFASILWKDSSRSEEACEVMKLTAGDLLELGVIDDVIPEPAGGAHKNPEALYQKLDTALTCELARFDKMSPTAIADNRYKKFRAMGSSAVKRGRV